MRTHLPALPQQPYQIKNTSHTATPVDVASPPLPLSMFLYTVQMSPVHTECRLSCRRRTLQSRHLAYLSSDKAGAPCALICTHTFPSPKVAQGSQPSPARIQHLPGPFINIEDAVVEAERISPAKAFVWIILPVAKISFQDVVNGNKGNVDQPLLDNSFCAF